MPHLTKEERDRIAQLSHQEFDQKEIAQRIGRSRSTICRELQRNRTGGEYLAAQAQEAAETRRRERPITCKLDDPIVNDKVRHCLTQNWSPEQITGRMKREHSDDRRKQVSPQTIYSWIEEDKHRDHWKSFLRRRGKRSRKRKNTENNGDGAPIRDRCDAIEGRLRIGDWEGDTVLGPPGTGGIVTLVDRKSRYTIITKIQSKDANHVHRRIKQRLKELHEEQCRSITFDNGREFARCYRLEKHLDMELYFADPGCPYQRGTNENTNGLIRQYFPKGSDFRNVTHQQVRKVEDLLNDRPRQCLDFETPREVFQDDYLPGDCV